MVRQCMVRHRRLRSARRGEATQGTARHSTARHGTAQCGTSHRAMSRHITSRHAAPRSAAPCLIKMNIILVLLLLLLLLLMMMMMIMLTIVHTQTIITSRERRTQLRDGEDFGAAPAPQNAPCGAQPTGGAEACVFRSRGKMFHTRSHKHMKSHWKISLKFIGQFQ